MALQNIGASNRDDAFYRYKMPKLLTKIEGRGNGIKTNIVNMVDVAKALGRLPSYTTKFFGCELGAQSKFDEKTGTSTVNGSHDNGKMVALLEVFIKKYVQCYGCGNPETEVLISKTQMISLRCAACGYISDVDMRDKLTTFILKNPPEQKKGGKDKKSLRRAEKERLKQGEALDEEQKKGKKDSKKKKSHDVNSKVPKMVSIAEARRRCPRCAAPLSKDWEKSSWSLAPFIRDSFSMIGMVVGGSASAFYVFNHGMPYVQRLVKGPMWLHFLIGAPPIMLFSATCAGLAGGVVPALAQLAVSSYHAALASSHSSISQVTMHMDDLNKATSPLAHSQDTQPVRNVSMEKNT